MKTQESFHPLEPIDCINCEKCCEECPQDIEIPVAFRLYNDGIKDDNPGAQMQEFLQSCWNLDDCVECGLCEEVCSQDLAIPDLLKKVDAYFKNAQK